MLDNIIDQNIVFLEKHGVKMDSEDDRAVYKYGLQILYYYITDLTVIFSLAFLFGKLYETIIMVFIFGLFQVFGGGYHAKTPLKCLTAMIIGAAAGNIIVMLITDNIFISAGSSGIFIAISLLSKPVENKKHPVGKKVKRRSKLMLRTIGILILAIIPVLCRLNKNIELALIAVTLGLYIISSVCAKNKKSTITLSPPV